MENNKFFRNKEIQSFSRAILNVNHCDNCGKKPSGYCRTISDDYLIRCGLCGLSGPKSDSVSIAVYAWNAQQEQKKRA